MKWQLAENSLIFIHTRWWQCSVWPYFAPWESVHCSAGTSTEPQSSEERKSTRSGAVAHTSAPALPSLGRAVWTADGSLPPCRLQHLPLQRTTKSTFKSRPFTKATRLRLHCLLGPELWSMFHFVKFPGSQCVSPIHNYTKNTCKHVKVLTSVGSTSELLSFWTKMKFCPFSVPSLHQLN